MAHEVLVTGTPVAILDRQLAEASKKCLFFVHGKLDEPDWEVVKLELDELDKFIVLICP